MDSMTRGGMIGAMYRIRISVLKKAKKKIQNCKCQQNFLFGFYNRDLLFLDLKKRKKRQEKQKRI